MSGRAERHIQWYEDLRSRWKPGRVHLLLIGESPPDPDGHNPRFFYDAILTQHDNLFRGVVLGLYGHRFPRGSAGTSKEDWLNLLKQDGVFLIDAVPFPINKVAERERRQARRDHADDAVTRASALTPAGIVVCHREVLRVLRPKLKAASLPLLHEEPLHFPMPWALDAFAEELRAATKSLAPKGGWGAHREGRRQH